MNTHRIGILISNLGTPASPKIGDIRNFLKAFLSDPYVVKLPRFVWLPLLYGIILPFRAYPLSKKYADIWTASGSPLRQITLKQAEKLQQALSQKTDRSINILPAMRYGKPSLEHALATFKAQHIETLLILPLYPQSTEATTTSTFEAINQILLKLNWTPNIQTIEHYGEHASYINTLAQSITKHWKKNTPGKQLIFSFHGLPIKNNDAKAYEKQCRTTAQLVANTLHLEPDRWRVVFQSRLGRAKWLTPYCDKTLIHLAQNDCESVDVICPGFAADCLETLEEINTTNRKLFLDAGGKTFHYIPALNDSEAHINVLTNLIWTYVKR